MRLAPDQDGSFPCSLSTRPHQNGHVRVVRDQEDGLAVRFSRQQLTIRFRPRPGSRFLVGSSAQTPAGRWRGLAPPPTRMTIAAMQLVGTALGAVREADDLRISPPRRRPHGTPRQRSRSGIATVSTAESTGEQVEDWKTNPMCRTRWAVRSHRERGQVESSNGAPLPLANPSRPRGQ